MRGRQIKIVGDYAVTCWLDMPVHIVMVVDIRPAGHQEPAGGDLPDSPTGRRKFGNKGVRALPCKTEARVTPPRRAIPGGAAGR